MVRRDERRAGPASVPPTARLDLCVFIFTVRESLHFYSDFRVRLVSMPTAGGRAEVEIMEEEAA